MGTAYYVDSVNGSDANSGLTRALAKKTLAAVIALNAGLADNDVVRAYGTFYEQFRLFQPGRNVTLDFREAEVRGDTILDKTTATSSAADTYEFALGAGSVDFGQNGMTLAEGIAAVFLDYDTSIDGMGRNYGAFTRATSNADCATRQRSFWFEPSGAAGSQNGAGVLRIRTTTGQFANLAAFKAASNVLAYVRGNRDGFEIGTPTYSDANFAVQDYPSTNPLGTRQLWLFPGKVTLWNDCGWRSYFNGGAGDPAQGVDVQANPGVTAKQAGTRSIGYGIRVADGINCTITGGIISDSGYHGAMFVGDVCHGNIMRNVVFRGCGLNPTSGCSIGGAFYTGNTVSGSNPDDSKNIYGCRAFNCTAYKYTTLGQETETVGGVVYAKPIAFPFNAAGNAMTISSTNKASPTQITTTAAHGLQDGTVVDVLINGSNGTTTLDGWRRATVTGASTLTIPVDTSGDATASTAGSLFTVCTCDGFISHTNAAANNDVLDVEYRNCTVIESGWRSNTSAFDNSMCLGNGLIGGSTGASPTTATDWRTYPVRFVNCTLKNAAFNRTSGTTSVAWVNCRFEFDRAGIYSSTTGSVPSASGTHSAMFQACTFRFTGDNAVSSARMVFQSHATVNLYLINNSVLVTGTGANTKYFINFVAGLKSVGNGAGIQSYCYARRNVFAFASDAGGTLQFATNGFSPNQPTVNPAYADGTGLSQRNMDFEDNEYANVPAGVYIGFPGPNTQAKWKTDWDGTGIDQTGQYSGSTIPFGNLTTLEPIAAVKTRLASNTATSGIPTPGINGLPFSGIRGAYQYGAGPNTENLIGAGVGVYDPEEDDDQPE